MAASDHSHGYQCKFIDSVNDFFFCKKCSVVARRLTVTSCCGESYCHTCIADIQQQDKPCPECGEQFTIYEQMKYQRQIRGLQVYCSMRGRGCDWSGTVEQLDAHLDPNQDNCQHVDIKCPLNCQQTIPKNKVEHHVAKECVKRDYICQYCAFKATYEVVVDTHLAECIYVPLQCPNLCGVTCERDVIEDHMQMCRLEEVACEFNDVGCDEKFIREDQEEHTRKNSQKHLILTSTTAAVAVQMNQQLLQKLQEQEQKFEKKLQEQDQKYEKKLQELEQKFHTMEQYFHKKLQEQERSVAVLQRENEVAESELKQVLRRTFIMGNFSKKNTSDLWCSPHMITHLHGYKFYIRISLSSRTVIDANLDVIRGDYDDQLKWPVKVRLTLEVVNQQGGEDKKVICTGTWYKPEIAILYGECSSDDSIEHAKFAHFIVYDSLCFNVTNIIFL